MSESETMGRCRREIAAAFEGTGFTANKEDWILADAIDRIAADVAAVKEATLPQTTEERDCAIRERDEAKADAERLRAELAARPAATGWLTEVERQILANLLLYQWGGLGWLARVAPALRAILDRAGSPPVVVLPTVFQHSSLGDKLVALQQVKDALDKAGVAWKEVGRE